MLIANVSRKVRRTMNNEKRHLVEGIFQDARFVQSLGIEPTSWGEGWFETRVKVVPGHRQQHGFAHAGDDPGGPYLRRRGCIDRA